MRRRWIATAAVGALLLAGCGAQASQDRTSGAGQNPDSTQDAFNVKVFLNADKVPNIALFCINPGEPTGPIAIMSTLSGTGESAKGANIQRITELDASYCGGKPK